MASAFDVGVVGSGDIAEKAHIPAYIDHPKTHLIAIVDPNERRCRRITKRYSIPRYYTSYEAFFENEDVDVVSIASPPHTHEPIFTLAAESATHILCEKPLTTSLESAERMSALADEYDVITQIGYALQYMANYRKVIDIVRSGLLGEILYLESYYYSPPPPSHWYYDRDVSGGGVVFDKFPHLLDFYMRVFDEEIRVSDRTFRYLKTKSVEDHAEIGLRAGSTPIDVTVGWMPGADYRSHVIAGEQGVMKFSEEELTGYVSGERINYRKGKRPIVQIDPVLRAWLPAFEDFDRKRVNDFISHVVDGDRRTSAPAERGVKIIGLIEDVYDGEAGS